MNILQGIEDTIEGGMKAMPYRLYFYKSVRRSFDLRLPRRFGVVSMYSAARKQAKLSGGPYCELHSLKTLLSVDALYIERTDIVV